MTDDCKHVWLKVRDGVIGSGYLLGSTATWARPREEWECQRCKTLSYVEEGPPPRDTSNIEWTVIA